MIRHSLLFLLAFLLLFVPSCSLYSQAQPGDVASYTLDVTLIPDTRRLTGTETITYRNTTDVPIPDLVFHLYLNAFRDETTLFMQGSGGAHRGNPFSPGENGWIEVDAIALRDGPALQLEPLEDGTLARAALPEPVPPGGEVVVELSFTAQLPRVFARTGWAQDGQGDLFFLVGQWFPKPGVWQGERGWNAHPFHSNAEFFADFGDYDVRLTVPGDYVTGATGTPAGAEENADGTQTVAYRAEDVIDFAWVASPNLRSATRRVGGTELVYLYLPEHEWSTGAALDAAELALRSYGEWFGRYPYPRLSVIDVPEAGSGAGGMEYPMFITAGARGDGSQGEFPALSLALLIYHEVGHQWWQSVVAFNEVEEPWLDEGFTDYATARLALQELGSSSAAFSQGRYGNPYVDMRRGTFLSNPGVPMARAAWEFQEGEYVVAAYAKPALSLLTLENVIGAEPMLEIMSTFFERYRFAHPTTADFQAVAEELSQEDVSWFFDGLVYGSATLDVEVAAIAADSVTLAREGGLCAPVPFTVGFAGGAEQRLEWDTCETERTFSFAGQPEVVSVDVDPEHSLFIELDWSDNRAAREPAATSPRPQAQPEPEPEASPEPAPPVEMKDVASYTIDVTLDPETRRLEAAQSVAYRNVTDRPIPDLVFHLYLNAFEDQETIFMQESGPFHRGFRWYPEDNSWIRVQELRLADGTGLDLEPLEDGTLARAVLPEPAAPGETVELELSFTAQLPRVFARTGWALDAAGDPFFMVGQWFPKLGVWTGDGWNAYPYHANAEYFANFGAYDVSITVPAGYRIAATGQEVDATAGPAPGTRTVRFQARDVIDFAWAASPNFQAAEDAAGPGTRLAYFYLPEHAWTVRRVLDAARLAVDHFGEWYGQYPYPLLTLVDVPDAGQGAGGMEYPTLVTVGAMDFTGLDPAFLSRPGFSRGLELVTIHEVGHQWWQSMVAFNEAEEPWLDEGFTDYSTMRLMNQAYGPTRSAVDAGRFELGYLDLRRAEYLFQPGVAMYGPAWEFGMLDYGIAAYSKPALALLTLQNVLGEARMNALMREFFARYQYAHPTTEDFRAVAQEVSGEALDWFFGDPETGGGLVYGGGTLNYRASALSGRSVTVTRQGDLAVPTEIEVTYPGGATERIAWDGAETERTFEFDRPVEQFIIDPDRDLAVELVWSDNGLSRQPDTAAWLAAASRLLYRLQDWLLILGGL